MKHTLACLVLSCLAGSMACYGDAPPDPYKQVRAEARQAYDQGNWKEAYDLYTQFIYQPDADDRLVVNDFELAVACLVSLNRVPETDAVREAMVEAHPKNRRVFQAVAQSYLNASHYGFMIAGAFERGSHRGGGRQVGSMERDRVRALQLMNQALDLAMAEPDQRDASSFYLDFASMLQQARGNQAAWRLTYLTDLSTLPDYDEASPWGFRGHYAGGVRGAPVDEEGRPVYHRIPDSFEDAATDGQRWRWLMNQAVEANPGLRYQVAIALADFYRGQFGVQTMADYSHFFYRPVQSEEDRERDTSGTYQLHTLGEDETIARLATGIRRFDLPNEFNFLRIYQEVADDPERSHGEDALNKLAQIFSNRRQYPEAAEYWRRNIEKYGPGSKKWKQKKLAQIVDNWGQFDGTMAQPAGHGATLEYTFRNGERVHFTAHRIRVKRLLDDVKDYLRSGPSQLKHQKLNLANLGQRLLKKNQAKYIGAEVADWTLDLKPAPRHFDRRVTVTTPLQEAGAYLLTALMTDGNTCKIVVWLNDTVIVKKPLASAEARSEAMAGDDDRPAYYFVADARTGAPVAGATVDFFGYWQERIDRKIERRHYEIRTTQFAERTDADGQVMPRAADMLPDTKHSRQWLITATTEQGRLAYLGFTGVWMNNYYDAEYRETKTYGITDRPVYRPDQDVRFKFWVRHARYDREETSDFAGKTFRVEIRNPKGDQVFSENYEADSYGGFEGSYTLPDDAPLGVYHALVANYGGMSFRVEEYKKPEFEVTVEAPTEPVMLGEKITATIKATYYFGAPVTEGKVKYKVTRTSHSATWYPPSPWDWFYGPGYWWFGYDYEWYPGWRSWGCIRPHPFWWPMPQTPPEVVAEQEVEVGEDGTVKIEIDTGPAKAIHGDQDHKYQITAEVTDLSRRTIVGQGQVLVARKPFSVYAWVDRGHYRVGDVVKAGFSARTVDQKPVRGEGIVTLYSIAYDQERQPLETAVQSWELATDEQGAAALQIKASRAGQYRLSYTLTDAKDHTIEGGYVFVVRGVGFDGKRFRFDHLELVTDQQDYQPGEKVSLMINTDQPDSTVVLFVRPANGVYLPPKIIRLNGQSLVETIAVDKKDMPNFFIEAFTVSDGKVYLETKEIAVPPEKRVINVAVEPSSAEYQPGAKAGIKVRLTDFLGKPFKGTTVISVYDKAVEYISGGSNVSEIREFFWKWRRHHNPRTEHNLERRTGNLTPKGQRAMEPIGVFGHSVADELREGGLGFGGRRERRVMKSMLARAPASMGMASFGDMDSDFNMAMDAAAPMEAEMAGGQPVTEVEPAVRSEFADTAYWIGALDTDEEGRAEVEFDMPENLTGWKIRTWAMGHGTRVGEGTAEVVTTKNLLLRLQAPRFFVEKDEVVLSANIHNYLDTEKIVRAVLELEGGTLEPMGDTVQTVTIEAGGEHRVDWRVKAVLEGEAIVRMKALSDEESDAMQMTFPVYVHGMLKMDAVSGALRPEQTAATFTMTVPAARRVEQSRLELRYSPTLAGAMVDALPYLAEYPYGCTEQTLSRFLPTVITRKILLDMDLDLAAIRDKRTNLNAQEIGEDADRAAQWKRWDRNPVFDNEVVDGMVRDGLKALYDMQLSDGGWGWFSGHGERSWPHTTAYVVHGFQTAEAAGLTIVPGVLDRGLKWLKDYQAKQVRLIENPKKGKNHAGNLDAFVFMVLTDAGIRNDEMHGFLYRDRNELAVYAKAMLGMALHKLGDFESRDMLIRNIDQYLVEDDENQTAWLNLPNGGYWWYWYGSEYEAHAYYLKLLALIDARSQKAAGLVKYLLNNRKHATYWNSTRDTAVCVEALADYLRAGGEDKPDLTVEIFVDGKKRKEQRITAENLFTFDNALVLEGEALSSGERVIEVRKKGTGPVYFNAYLTNFTLEDPIGRAGLEIKVDRKVYRLKPVDKKIKAAGSRGQAVDQRVEKYEREPLENLATLTSGDLVEIELVMESKNDYEYLVFEDMKAAGFEPVDVRSGYTGNDLGAYVEFRDERVSFFVRQLARGRHSVAYRLRAEIPGRYSALPARGYAMYAPELKANSDEIKLEIVD